MTEQRFDASLRSLDFGPKKRGAQGPKEVSDVKFDDVLSKVERRTLGDDAESREILDVLDTVNDAFDTFESRSKKRSQEASEAMVQRQILEQNHIDNGFRTINQDSHQG